MKAKSKSTKKKPLALRAGEITRLVVSIGRYQLFAELVNPTEPSCVTWRVVNPCSREIRTYRSAPGQSEKSIEREIKIVMRGMVASTLSGIGYARDRSLPHELALTIANLVNTSGIHERGRSQSEILGDFFRRASLHGPRGWLDEGFINFWFGGSKAMRESGCIEGDS